MCVCVKGGWGGDGNGRGHEGRGGYAYWGRGEGGMGGLVTGVHTTTHTQMCRETHKLDQIVGA